MAQYQYVKSRISEAVDELCIGPGDVRSRLLAVNECTLSLVDHHFPEDLLAKWHEINDMLTKYGPALNYAGKPVEGAVKHTLRRIKNSTGSKIAMKFLELHNLLQENY